MTRSFDMDANRLDRHKHRYNFEVPFGNKVEFCQQVGQFDVWLTPYEVLIVTPPPKGETLGKANRYTYKHAGQRFPLIEHKILAMKAMLFGAN